MAMRANPMKNALAWYCNQELNQQDLQTGIDAYNQLVALLNNYEYKDHQQVTNIVQRFRIELEYAKYFIARQQGPEALEVIQSALDHYYKETDAPHLHFHVYTRLYPMPFFNRLASSTQIDAQIQWDAKSVVNGNFW
ncbi:MULTISPECIES: hypothetical protein [Shewanella]|uniref:hypothetical protein n=1 Tax=Shewanella TaxID=22 RepID=UPI001AB017D3|nr:hypothetical protein [Shewanella algae]EKT4487400.1 hypothetical protein [Shewanella algae]MBO2546558.1 hypothetical protein [Shewanella algae]